MTEGFPDLTYFSVGTRQQLVIEGSMIVGDTEVDAAISAAAITIPFTDDGRGDQLTRREWLAEFDSAYQRSGLKDAISPYLHPEESELPVHAIAVGSYGALVLRASPLEGDTTLGSATVLGDPDFHSRLVEVIGLPGTVIFPANDRQ